MAEFYFPAQMQSVTVNGKLEVIGVTCTCGTFVVLSDHFIKARKEILADLKKLFMANQTDGELTCDWHDILYALEHPSSCEILKDKKRVVASQT
jgi:hypothetical protein